MPKRSKNDDWPNWLVKLTPKATLLVPSTRFAPCGAAYRGRSAEEEMKSRVICKSGGNPLTNWLEPVEDGFFVTWLDSENIIPQGHYWIADDDMATLQGRIVIHLDDRQGMNNHPDPLRFQGCFGSSDGRINLLCQCGTEVATEVSDCWTSYYAYFEPEAAFLQAFSETTTQAEHGGGGNSA